MKKPKTCPECGKTYKDSYKVCYPCYKKHRLEQQKAAGDTCQKCGKPPQKAPLVRNTCGTCRTKEYRAHGTTKGIGTSEKEKKIASTQNKDLIALYKRWGYSQEKIAEALHRQAA